jgi:hypothetical protein
MAPPEPVCACHGWPGSVCDARAAAASIRFRRWFALAWCAGGAIATVLLALLRGPTVAGTFAAVAWGGCVGIALSRLLGGGR